VFIAKNELKIKVLGPKIDNPTFLPPILYLESGLVDNTLFALKKKIWANDALYAQSKKKVKGLGMLSHTNLACLIFFF